MRRSWALLFLLGALAGTPLLAREDELGELEKAYFALEPAERAVWALAQRRLASPDDVALRREHLEREQALKDRLEPLTRAIETLAEKSPADVKVQSFHLRFVSEQVGVWVVGDEAAKLYSEHPEDRDGRVVFAETCMVVPEFHSPRFARAYEAIAPVASAEPGNQDVQLIFGVAACALGKNADARAALARVAAIGSIRPQVVAVTAGVLEPAPTFAIWKETASGLCERPHDALLLARRAELLLEVNANALATADAEAAVRASPGDARMAKVARRCLAATNDFDRAVAILERLLAANPGDDEVRAEYGLALYRANRMVESRDVLAKTLPEAMARFPDKLRTAVFDAGPETLVLPWAAEEKARAADARRDDDPRVRLETEKGAITLELFEDTAPNTVASFVHLAGDGFFDGVRFHRVLAGFMAQGGDRTGNGDGGPGYRLKDEVARNPRLHWRGTLSMAKGPAPDSAGSQFFICFAPAPHLNGKHAVFGRVIEGQGTVDQLEPNDRIEKARVVRKRDHAYVPEMIRVPGEVPWTPGEGEPAPR